MIGVSQPMIFLMPIPVMLLHVMLILVCLPLAYSVLVQLPAMLLLCALGHLLAPSPFPMIFPIQVLVMIRLFILSGMEMATCTYNTHGACGDILWSDPGQASCKAKAVQKLMLSHSATHLQESHSDEYEIGKFSANWAHTHIIHHSNGLTRNEGGLISAYSHKFISLFDSCFQVDLVPGRALASFFVSEKLILVHVDVHIPPHWSVARQRFLLNKIRSSIPSIKHGIIIINGDFNFAYDPDTVTAQQTLSGHSRVGARG